MNDARVSPLAGRDPPLDKQPATIAGMFDAIARRYDLLNHLLSGGSDWYWRWRAVRALRLQAGDTVLDLCTGTADFAIESLVRGRVRRVVGVDFAGEMLRIAQAKLDRRGLAARAALVRGDATRIPLGDACTDAVTIAFGVRNVQDPSAACREMARVLRPGGRLAVLEFSMPTLPVVRPVYAWYFRHVLPRIGRIVSRHHDAYAYLPASVGTFITPSDFRAMLDAAGFAHTSAIPLTLGVVTLYAAVKP